MKATSLAVAAALFLGACSHNHPRHDTVLVTYECYDWWPYVYYAPYDCWDTVWYGPAYYYYPYRTYSYPAVARPQAPLPRASAKIRLQRPDVETDDGLPPVPGLPRPRLPIP